jgi:hypothetical protein
VDLLTGKWGFFCSSRIGGGLLTSKWGYFSNLRFGAFPHLKNGGTWSPPARYGIDSVYSHTWGLLSIFVDMTFLTCTRSSVVS